MATVDALRETEDGQAGRAHHLIGREVDNRVGLVGERVQGVLHLVDTQEAKDAQHGVRAAFPVHGRLLDEDREAGIFVTQANEFEKTPRELTDGVRLVGSEGRGLAVHLMSARVLRTATSYCLLTTSETKRPPKRTSSLSLR